MTRGGMIGVALAITIGGAMARTGNGADDPSAGRAAAWRAVDQALAEQRPLSALGALEGIEKEAIAAGAWDEVARAIATRASAEAAGRAPDDPERLVRLARSIDTAPAPTRGSLEAIAANWMVGYFQANRWRFHERTSGGAEGGVETIAEWDLPKIVAAIRGRFAAALGAPGSAARRALQGQRVADWSALLPPATMPDAYRPTLFDVVAHDALSFHTLGERGLVEPEDAFTLEADGPVLDGVAEFRAWRPEETATDADAPALAAALLFRELLDFHADDADRTAFLAVDLERIEWAARIAVGDDVGARHRAALERFISAAGDHETGALARYHLAEQLRVADPAAARSCALEGAERHPDAPGGRRCRELVVAIEAPTLQVLAERSWAEPWPALHVRYRNVARLHVRICRADWQARLAAGRAHASWIDEQERAAILALAAERRHTVDLPATADFRERHEDVSVAPLAEGLAPGAWWVIASPTADAAGDGNPVSVTLVWIGRLALVAEPSRALFVGREGGDAALPLAGHVVDLASGEPVAGAEVVGMVRDPEERRPGYRALAAVTTDATGRFAVPGQPGRETILTATATLDGVRHEIVGDPLHVWAAGLERDVATVVLVTDRGIHRPGQTLFFKGIACAGDRERGEYRALARQHVSVVLRDANGREVATATTTTSANGGFDGTFALPAGGLPGQWSLHATCGSAQGGVGVRVEEYRRPKFRVELAAPAARVALGGEVLLTGTATTYTGLPVAGAKVAWRVERLVRWPEWCRWVVPGLPQGGEARAIARGTARTDEMGRFTFRFAARADRAIPAAALPVFRFRAEALVTDAAGETQGDERTVSVGYGDVEATVTAAAWQTATEGTARVPLTVTTASLDGDPLAVTGRLSVVRLVQPPQVERVSLFGDDRAPSADRRPGSAPETWPAGAEAFTAVVTTDAAGRARIDVPLPPGIYRATFASAAGEGGAAAKGVGVVEVLDPGAAVYPVRVPLSLHCERERVVPGETFRALVGTGYAHGRALVEISQSGRTVSRQWTEPGRTQWELSLPVDGTHRGGFTVRAWLVRDGRLTTVQRTIDVPWSDRKLTLTWERFTRRVEPGAREVWRARVTGADAAGVEAPALVDVLAILHDESLEALAPHQWPTDGLLGIFRREQDGFTSAFTNTAQGLVDCGGAFVVPDVEVPPIEYREFRFPFGRPRFLGRGGMVSRMRGAPEVFAAAAMADGPVALGAPMEKLGVAGAPIPPATPPRAGDAAGAGGGRGGDGPSAASPTPRRRLVETAFFLPSLATAADGTVSIEFTLPDTLTTWRFKGLAHDARLRSGTLVDSCVAAKDLMVEALVPRFVREGDVVEVPVKVGNRSTGRLAGTVRLALADARGGDDRGDLVDGAREQPFDLAAGESCAVAFTLRVTPGTDLLEYTATASADRTTDGEQALLPVLPARVPVTDTIPVTLRGPTTRTVTLDALAAAPPGVENEALVVQAAANPAWYAVLALPVLVEDPDESCEGVFSRLYAHALAAHLVTADPRIEKVFAQWREDGQLAGPLERNEALVRTRLEETPWVRDAEEERAARGRIALLFDRTRTATQIAAALERLEAARAADGGWPWFPGGVTSDPVTLAIVAGFGRLRAAGVPIDVQPALATLPWLDRRLVEERRRAEVDGRRAPEAATLTAVGAFALYARSFFTADVPPQGEAADAVAWGIDLAARTWMTLDARLPQGHAAIALARHGRRDAARRIVDSLAQRAVDAAAPAGAAGDAWQGMWWRDAHPGWWSWAHAPIATQAVMIEAFDEVAGDAAAVEALKVWLLCQKRTSRWGASRATADAVGALLGRGADLLGTKRPVEVTIGGEAVAMPPALAGTGFRETRLLGAAITPDRATVTFSVPDEGLAFGGIHWLHRAPIGAVAAVGRAELSIDKALAVRRVTKGGAVLEPLADGAVVAPGDEVVVRLVVKSDRDYEFLEIADHRPSLAEPVDGLSGWRSGDGVAWYQAVRDASTRLFVERLPRGTHVFEYGLRVARRGQVAAGFATIASRYAPEFSARSASLRLHAR